MTITVSLPPELEEKMPPSRAKLHLAIGAFAAEEVTLGQAAEIASVSQADLMRELSLRHIPLHYGREEFAQDLEAIAQLSTSDARHQ
jgi:predicted HTH domain antitoxin